MNKQTNICYTLRFCIRHLVGNKAKVRISKWVFWKNEHFLPPDTHMCVCVSRGKNCSLFGKFDVLCFLETPVFRFAILPYYWLFKPKQKTKQKVWGHSVIVIKDCLIIFIFIGNLFKVDHYNVWNITKKNVYIQLTVA